MTWKGFSKGEDLHFFKKIMIILAAGGKRIWGGKSENRGNSWGTVPAIQQQMIVALSKGDGDGDEWEEIRAIWEVQIHNPRDLLRPKIFFGFKKFLDISLKVIWCI